MKERPILFSAPMVNAILEGRKTQTRRVVAPLVDYNTHDYSIQEFNGEWGVFGHGAIRPLIDFKCPYGQPGDRLWVRETWADVNTSDGPAICYRADGAVRTWHDFSETFGPDYGAGPSMDYDSYPGSYTMWYSDLLDGVEGHGWKPSIFMPRWASRITLEITSVRVERLNDISEEDADAEGFGGDFPHVVMPDLFPDADAASSLSIPECFRVLWESINGKGSWDANPWCWVIEFHPIQ